MFSVLLMQNASRVLSVDMTMYTFLPTLQCIGLTNLEWDNLKTCAQALNLQKFHFSLVLCLTK
jgi:hypothetical protein